MVSPLIMIYRLDTDLFTIDLVFDTCKNLLCNRSYPPLSNTFQRVEFHIQRISSMIRATTDLILMIKTHLKWGFDNLNKYVE